MLQWGRQIMNLWNFHRGRVHSEPGAGSFSATSPPLMCWKTNIIRTGSLHLDAQVRHSTGGQKAQMNFRCSQND